MKERAIKEVETIESGISPMDRVSMTSEDVNVAKFVLFVNTDNNMLYVDSEKTKKATLAEVREAFYAGCVLNVSGDEVVPIRKIEHDAEGSAIAYCELCYGVANTTTPTQADIAKARSTDGE